MIVPVMTYRAQSITWIMYIFWSTERTAALFASMIASSFACDVHPPNAGSTARRASRHTSRISMVFRRLLNIKTGRR
ncbi:hypothetical protein GALMADRAFT_394273 [Galerina marginata CBS 339.88]|uniref:Uncharacterized protein n=1 Tax=Galerina marginata (strain CBS 339.88) TaxID=685588 RepID=A0A067U3G1_GALM3|nr:hypothetical protein GALMADRAFT_394273 [Galerina marginata CBS 339.88]